MVPAYDDETLWAGHSSMIEEISTQLPNKPSAIFCSVGGGGLLGGIITGCKHVGWDDGEIRNSWRGFTYKQKLLVQFLSSPSKPSGLIVFSIPCH